MTPSPSPPKSKSALEQTEVATVPHETGSPREGGRERPHSGPERADTPLPCGCGLDNHPPEECEACEEGFSDGIHTFVRMRLRNFNHVKELHALLARKEAEIAELKQKHDCGSERCLWVGGLCNRHAVEYYRHLESELAALRASDGPLAHLRPSTGSEEKP